MDRRTNTDQIIEAGNATGQCLSRRKFPSFRDAAPWLVFTLACLCFFPLLSAAQAKDEHMVKAAFVFNLTKYVEWHANAPRDAIVIGFIGEGSMGRVLEQVLSGKAAGTKTVRVIVEPSNQQLEQCNIIYISYASPQKLRAALQRMPKNNVLTIGDTTSFAESGGVVGLVTTGDHVQIQINPAAAEAAHLKISSRLLNLATLVSQAPVR
jgi:hypothetical protein